jgi:hypothetical protein
MRKRIMKLRFEKSDTGTLRAVFRICGIRVKRETYVKVAAWLGTDVTKFR